jgi:membrane protease YdiL (CAAX protease family)
VRSCLNIRRFRRGDRLPALSSRTRGRCGNCTPPAYWVALFVASVLFGSGHCYQGPAGIFTTACDGFVIGAAYLLSGRNLWVTVLVHSLVDTPGITLLFFGLSD